MFSWMSCWNQTTAFIETLAPVDLQQHIDFPTQIHGHSLDLIITSNALNPTSVKSSDSISDHVIATLNMPGLTQNGRKNQDKIHEYKINRNQCFQEWHPKSCLLVDPGDTAEKLAKQYGDILTFILDKHAPLSTKLDIPKPNINPWMSPAILAVKRHRPYLKRTWPKNPKALNRSRHTRPTHLWCPNIEWCPKPNRHTTPKLSAQMQATNVQCGRGSIRFYTDVRPCLCPNAYHLANWQLLSAPSF